MQPDQRSGVGTAGTSAEVTGTYLRCVWPVRVDQKHRATVLSSQEAKTVAHTEALRGANSTVHAGLGMEVLYVRPNFLPTSGKEAIAERGHHEIGRASCRERV